MGSIAKKGLQNYTSQLQKHPLRTKALTAATLSLISDIVSQKLSGIKKLQLKRLVLKVGVVTNALVYEVPGYLTHAATSVMMCIITVAALSAPLALVLFGFAYLGPGAHFYHLYLDKLFKGKKDSKTVAQKVVVDQLTISPFNNFLFMVYFGLAIEGRPWNQVKSKIKAEFPKVQTAAWTIGPVMGWVSHRYVPLQFRVVVSSLFAFFWGIFLNLRARSTLAIAKG